MVFPKFYNPETQQWENLPLSYEGLDGLSAYEIAVEHGYEGTEEEWLASLYANLTADEVKELYESNEDTNAFTDLYKLKLNSLWSTVGGSADGNIDFTNYVTIQDLSDYVNLTDLVNYVTIQDLSDYVNLTDLLSYPTISDMEFYVDTRSSSFTEEERVKLAGIESGAQVNVQVDWSILSGEGSILNKPNIDAKADLESPVLTGIPTAPTANPGTNTTQIATTAFVQWAISASDVYTDENAQDAVGGILSAEFVYNDATPSITIDNVSVDKLTEGTTNKLFTSALKTKLDGIAAGAEVNVQADWNAVSGDALILNKPDLSGYLTPSNTTPYTPTNDYNPATKLYVDQSIVNAGGYTDENAQDAIGSILSTEFTYNDSTPLISVSSLNVDKLTEGATNKLFTSALKTKLDGIATGAEVNVQADWNAVSGDALILNKPTLLTINDVQNEIDAVQFPTYITVAAGAIDCSLGVYFFKEVSGDITFSFTNPYSAGTVYSCTLEVKHVSGVITWPVAVSWSGGVAPSLTTNKTHIFTFVTIDGGVKWRGTALPDYTI